MSMPLVIVGTGLAGYNLAREYRKLDTTSPLLLVTADDGAFYSKPMLSHAMGKNKRPADLVMAEVSTMSAELNAEIISRKPITELQSAQHRLVFDDANSVEYRQCVLAVGAQPIILPTPGNATDRFYRVNNLQDYVRFRAAIEGKQRIAIIGPGLIGCEFANDLAACGYHVQVIGPDPHPLGRLVPAAIGHAVQNALMKLGVVWHLRTTVKKAQQQHDQIVLTLENDQPLEVDVVLSAVGLRPNTSMAERAGLQINRGIVVDRYFSTSAQDIYALGDCAEVEGLVLPFVLPIMQAVRALARTLAGNKTAVNYPPMPVVVKLPACPLVVAPPAAGAQGEWRIEESNGGITALFQANERLLGFALTGQAVVSKLRLTKQLPALIN